MAALEALQRGKTWQTPEEGRRIAAGILVDMEGANKARERRLVHEMAQVTLGEKHNSLQAQITGNLQQIAKKEADQAGHLQEEKVQAEKVVKIFVGRIFLANLKDKAAGQKDALGATSTFLKDINNDALNGPIYSGTDGKVPLTAEVVNLIANILAKNSSWASLDVSGARGAIDVQAMKSLLGQYTNIENVILGKGQQETKRILDSSSARQIKITISEK